jgi:crotonobetainyl-CoA:carnitine CoA-transferase CaiB-like acyl-CoA transferase
MRMLAFPYRLSAGPVVVRRPAPRLGEHTDEVLQELGVPAAEIERLAGAAIVQL